tara:strand:+ start:4946 stop:5572 length:627 start_codon:yes stop_codon:yes gene_type:complete
MNIMKTIIVFLFFFYNNAIFSQNKSNSYSFTLKEVLAFKNRIKELERKDSLNNILIKKMDDRISVLKNELSVERIENARLIEKVPTVEKKKTQENNINLGIQLLSAFMCRRVENGTPSGMDTKFSPSQNKSIYCFSKLNNYYESSSAVYHLWYQGTELKAKVRIRLGSGNERTAVSQRIITNEEAGYWRVEVATADQKVLQIISFEVV